MLSKAQDRLILAFHASKTGVLTAADLKAVSSRWCLSLGKLMPKFVETIGYCYKLTDVGRALARRLVQKQ